MSRTVQPHNRASHRRGEYIALCSYCGVEWPRSKLRKDGAGLFACPDEGAGKDAVTLSREIAACAARPAPSRRPMDAPPARNGGYDPPSETADAAIARIFGGA